MLASKGSHVSVNREELPLAHEQIKPPTCQGDTYFDSEQSWTVQGPSNSHRCCEENNSNWMQLHGFALQCYRQWAIRAQVVT